MGGGQLAAYDEAFRSLRQQRGWAWDSVILELWMNVSQSSARIFFRRVVLPFKARVRPDRVQPVHVSFTTGGGVGSCRGYTCCRCNGPHPLFRCRAHEKRYGSSSPSPSIPPAGPSSAPGPPAWSRKLDVFPCLFHSACNLDSYFVHGLDLWLPDRLCGCAATAHLCDT